MKVIRWQCYFSFLSLIYLLLVSSLSLLLFFSLPLIVTAFALTTMITKSHIKFALKVEHNVSLLWEMQKKWVRACVSESERQSTERRGTKFSEHYTMPAECSDCGGGGGGDAPTEHWYEWEIMIGSKNMNWRRTTARVYEFCRFVAATAAAARLPKYV